ncbi:MAG TPA: DUF6644 family protein [Bryobacteraceae bacterium]|nr:DUF6644 family protein [Bryobacteraceae bacterium]
MSLLFPFFKWCDGTWVGAAIRGSKYAFPVIEAIHLLGLTVLLGVMVVISLRLFGFILKHESTRELATDLRPYTWGSIVTMLVTGFLLFASEALKCYDSSSFRFKMACLILALIFQVTVYHRATTAMDVDKRPGFAKLTAILALALWFGVGLGGRAIGFL